VAEATTNDTAGIGGAVGEEDFVALAPGKTIGRYEIVAILGQGGFGITYRARDDQLHREVAIKEYLPSALAIRQDGVTVLPRSTKVAEDFSWGRQRFVDEGRTLATLQRAPAIVRVFDFLEANGTAYIVMELVPGDTLEHRLKNGHLTPAELDRILWPLLDGLEQVHATGFLHRDIKPANILLDAQGNPTLIDFGASRAAMAGRSQAMTAIFTPGYAAAEQMTSAKQGPWTDIYGLSATLYHAITGAVPPSAFDRMLDDEYQPLGQLQPPGFLPGLLVGLDAGLAVRASDRPQSIAGWRPILGQASMADAQATMALARSGDANATTVVRRPTVTPATIAPPTVAPTTQAKSGKGLWLGLAALVVLALAGGGYWYANRPPAVDVAARFKAEADAKARAQAQATEAAKAKKDQEELDRLRAEQVTREQQAHDEVVRRQAAEEARQKLLAEEAEQKKVAEAAAAKAAADEAARQKALESDRANAAESEAKLNLGLLNRQHVQVALNALGFGAVAVDGAFGQSTHDMIAAWQKTRSYPATGYLTGPENQELRRAGAAAIARFDDEQKKAEAAKEKATAAPASPVAPPQTAAASPPAAAGSIDGNWTGTYHCNPNNLGGPFTMPVHLSVQGGHGVYTMPGSTETSPGNHSLAITITGRNVFVQRTFLAIGGKNSGKLIIASINAHLEGGTITGSGLESQGGRFCTLTLSH
jgi:peptidoglycan hydrolase-like protein with peptidoglycan-binding domain